MKKYAFKQLFVFENDVFGHEQRLLAQVVKEKKGEFEPYYNFNKLKESLDKILELK